MSFFRVGRSILKNTQRSLSVDLLETNKFGAFCSTSILGCNTRKYHGLLVSPIKNTDKSNYVLLSSLDESVLLSGVEYKIGMHDYGDGVYQPTGNMYLMSFSDDKTPCFTYKVGKFLISKELLLSSVENRIMIRYTLLDAEGKQATLRFRPVLAFRSVDALCQANYNLKTSNRDADNGISMSLYTGFPDFYMQFSDKETFVVSPSWIRGIHYYKEQWRGYNYIEDLFVPGYFELNVEKGQSVIFTAALTELKSDELRSLYRQELGKREENKDMKSAFHNAVKSFVYKKSLREKYLKAGYPWLGCRARDMVVSIPGATLPFDDKAGFNSLVTSLSTPVRVFLNGDGNNKTPLPDFDNPDILLWLIRDIQLYADKYGIKETWTLYGELLVKLLSYFSEGKHPLVECHENGLLYVKGGWVRPLTWMNAIDPFGHPITPRSGYVIEVNSLWYNDLLFVSDLASSVNHDDVAHRFKSVAEKVRNSFTPVFWNGTYLYDFVDGDHHEVSVRPNMLFAVSLPYSPLDEIQKKLVLDMVTKELLTPKGLRSLSPHSQNYHGWSGGDQRTRDYESFQGAVYPWLIATYVDAYLKVYEREGHDFTKRVMSGFDSELSSNCVGTLPEMYDATMPYTARGASSYLMNVAEVARAYDTVGKLK